MSALISWHRTGGHRTGWAHLHTAQPDGADPDRFRVFLTAPASLRKAVCRFARMVTQLEERAGDWKLELVHLDGAYWLRLCALSGPIRYRLIPAADDTPVRMYPARSFRRPALPAPSGTWNVVTGRHAEKFLHEWLSHPAEDGLPLPEGITLRHVSPEPPAVPVPRLIRGWIHPIQYLPLPDRFLFLRTVSEGRYDPLHRRIHVNVSESFVRTGDLLQSVCPFRFHVSLDDLNRGYAGAVSRRCWPPVGFFCSKFGQPVFGRIDSPPLLFRHIPLSVEE